MRKRDEPVRLTRIYTRAGDAGETSLGDGSRVPKTDRRIEAYGTVDELNSAIGVALAHGLDAGIADPLQRVQNDLFHLGADLSRNSHACSNAMEFHRWNGKPRSLY